MPKIDIQLLRAEIVARAQNWQARENTIALLSDDKKRALLGVVVDENARRAAMVMPPQASPPNFAPAVD
jgi:hypothetical protein